MQRFKNAVITDINEIVTIYSQKGRKFKSLCRRSYGLSFCRSGSITYKINDRCVISDPSCAVILPYGGCYTLSGTKTGYFPLINFMAAKTTLISDIIKIPINNPDFYMKEYKKLKQAEILGHSHFKKMEILYNILKNLFDDSKTMHPALKTAVSYIEENYNDPNLSNPILAKICGISEVYLRKLFVSHLNTTPKQYITDMRIQRAKLMLIENQMSMSDIAPLCGFGNIYNFCRAFKAASNMTPSEYRTSSYKNTSFPL